MDNNTQEVDVTRITITDEDHYRLVCAQLDCLMDLLVRYSLRGYPTDDDGGDYMEAAITLSASLWSTIALGQNDRQAVEDWLNLPPTPLVNGEYDQQPPDKYGLMRLDQYADAGVAGVLWALARATRLGFQD